jgi:hypothetical protein
VHLFACVVLFGFSSFCISRLVVRSEGWSQGWESGSEYIWKGSIMRETGKDRLDVQMMDGQ